MAPKAPADPPAPAPPPPGADSPSHAEPAEAGAAAGDAVGWLVSLVLHALVALALLLIGAPFRPEFAAPTLFAEASPDEAPDEFVTLDDADPAEAALAEEGPLSDALNPSQIEPVAVAPGLAELALSAPSLLSTLPGADDLGRAALADAAIVSGTGTAGRGEESRGRLIEAKGGTADSELAVALALDWIADHQNPDGSWSLAHDLGKCRGRCPNTGTLAPGEPDQTLRCGTALALLPMLGAGNTPERGRHRRVVQRGLRALVAMGRVEPETPGASWADAGRMYAHGLAAIVLAEAYGMTGDSELGEAAQASADFLAYAQDPLGGGWRYTPQQPGDTSVTGWQVMALKSQRLAGLRVGPRAASGARRFLDAAQHSEGAAYGYLALTPQQRAEGKGNGPTPTLTAVGLLCRMLLGLRQDDPRLTRGVEALVQRGPSPENYYHNYYAAQTIFHATGGEGPLWNQWNTALRDQLVEQQQKRGHPRGSWWIEGPHNDRGGRLYTTSLATMTLEVYYRYLPLYQKQAVEQELPE